MIYANLWTNSDIIAVARKWSRVDGIQKHFYNELWNELLGSCKDDAAGVGSWSCVKDPSLWSQPNFPRITMLKQGPGARLRPKRELVPAHYGPESRGETIGWMWHTMWAGRSTFGCFNIPRIINQGHQMLLCSTLARADHSLRTSFIRSQRILWNLSNKQCSHCLIESVYTPYLYSMFLIVLKDCGGFKNKIPLIKLQWPFKSWMNFPSSFIQLWLLPIFCRTFTIIGSAIVAFRFYTRIKELQKIIKRARQGVLSSNLDGLGKLCVKFMFNIATK